MQLRLQFCPRPFLSKEDLGHQRKTLSIKRRPWLSKEDLGHQKKTLVIKKDLGHQNLSNDFFY